jgi:copper(I)-binding protein
MTRVLLFSTLLLATACGKPAPASVDVTDAWARATAAGQPSGAVYAAIANKGGTADRLVGASTDRASMAMIHENSTTDGISRMRMVDGVDVPSGGRVELKPGGTHIMLDGLKAPLVAGERLEVRLRFEKSGVKAVSVQVVAAGAR